MPAKGKITITTRLSPATKRAARSAKHTSYQSTAFEPPSPTSNAKRKTPTANSSSELKCETKKTSKMKNVTTVPKADFIMKANRPYFLSLALCITLICGAATHRTYGEEPATDFSGMRFRCGKLTSGNICLSVLIDECSLRIVPGEGIPRAAGEKLVLTRGNQEHVVASPRDLHECVSINTKDEALEYLRFFSAHRMTHLFENRYMEIFQGSDEECMPGRCLPTHRWRKLKLKSVTVKKKGYNFEIRRNIVRPKPHTMHVSAFQITERVTTDGEVSLISEKAVQLEIEDEARLTFPRSI
jgi:hypothetical protein